MALKFRRGTTAQQSGSLAFGEPYVNTTLGTLLIGGDTGDIVLATAGTSSTGNFGPISGSGLDITGNANIAGNLTLGGAITIGDATADTVNVVASLSSSLIPSNDNAFDVGRNDKRYRAVYGNTLSASVLEIESGSTVEIRLKNSTTGIRYDIQNTNGGNLAIHNSNTGQSIIRIDSGSFPQQTNIFGNLNVSQSLSVGNEVQSATGSFDLLRTTDTISGSITGIGNVSSYSSSVNSRLVVVEGVSASAAGALNSVSGAFATTFANLDTNYATDAQLSSVSGAVATTIANLGSTYATDAELSTVSGAFATTIGNLNSTYATDAEVSTISGAIATTDAAQDVLISSLQSNILSASVFNTFSNSVDSRLDTVELVSASAASALNSVSGAIVTTISNLGNTYATDAELSSVSGAFATRVAGIDSTVSSLSTSVDSRLDVVEGVSASAASALNSLSSSASSTYAKVGAANTFNGNQTITGSLFISQNLIVQGSSSIQNISSSTLNIGTNLITVNTLNPGTRFGGLAVIDSGSSPLISGSILFDSINDQWIFVHQIVSGAATTSSVFLMGPQTYNSLGSEVYPTTNRVVKSINSEHIGDSNITDNGTLITLGSNTSVTGTLVATGTSLVSGSSQISYTGLSNIPAGIVSGSSQIDITATTGYSTFSGAVATTISNLGSTYATDAELSSVSGAFATTVANLGSTYATDAELSSVSGAIVSTINNLGSTYATDSELNTVSGAFATTIGNLDNTYATDASVTSVSGAFATTIGNLGSTYATDSELSTVSGAFATTIGNLGNTYATDAELSSLSGAVATTVANLGSTYATDAELSSVSGAIATRDAGQDTTISTLSSSVASRLGTLETKDITITLTGDVTGTGTITDLGNVSFATTVAANSVALGTDTTGDYVANLGSGTGLTIGSNSGEGSTPTIAVNYGSTSNTAVQGNTALSFAGTTGEISIDSGSSITLGSGGTVTIGLADTITGNRTFSNDIIITGNLTVNGTTTTVNSNTVNIGDNLLVLNSDEAGTPSQNAGIEIERGTSQNASLVWDEANDVWSAGLSGSEVPVVTTTTSQTLTNKTISGASNTLSNIANSSLTNSSITIAGTSTALGGSITAATILGGTGVVSGSAQLPAGTVSGSAQIDVSSTTGDIALGTRTSGNYVASLVAGTNITLTNNTGEGATPTIGLTNNAITIAGTSTSLGGSITLGTITAGSGIVSGSSQVTSLLPAGTVSGSSQVYSGVSGDITIASNGVATIAANSVALGTDTTGNYMSDVSAGTGVSVSHTPGEGSTATISIGQAVSTSSNVTFGNVTATGTVSGSTFTGLGNLTTYSSSVASRLVTLEGKDFTITLTGDVTGTGTVTDLGNVSFATTIAADSVALGTDTTGNYVATITAGTGVSSTGATTGEGIAHTISIGQAVATSSNVQFNSLGVGMAASATAGRIDATNDIVAFSSSDIRFKENIKPIENPIEKIRKISGNTYDWKEENKIEHGYEGNDVGVIAQEIEAVLPQLVQTRESGYKAVKYDKLVALLIEGIKEQQLQIEQLRIDLDNCRNKGL